MAGCAERRLVGLFSLGGELTSNPAVARYADGRLAAFVRGANGAVYERRQQQTNGAWGGWVSLGGWIGNNPAVGQFADGWLAIFVQGTNSAPY